VIRFHGNNLPVDLLRSLQSTGLMVLNAIANTSGTAAIEDLILSADGRDNREPRRLRPRAGMAALVAWPDQLHHRHDPRRLFIAAHPQLQHLRFAAPPVLGAGYLSQAVMFCGIDP